MAAAAAIDALDINDIVGSLAGDDTIFLIVRQADHTMDVVNKFSKYIR